MWRQDSKVSAQPGFRLSEARSRVVAEFEKQHICFLLARNRGRVDKTAQEAGISTRQLNKLMNRYGIQKESFKP
jgi:DNA-binding NtrC family response regulator